MNGGHNECYILQSRIEDDSYGAGGEMISRDLHTLFGILANGIHDSPVCVFVFFEHVRFESWHALAAVPAK